MIKNKSVHKAFSILEMTVVLGITGVIMVMLSNVLVSSISISQRSVVRSFSREEVANVANAVITDINAANEIESCLGNILGGIQCTLVTDQQYTWTTCPGSRSGQIRICKKNVAGEPVFVSSDNLDFTVFTIEPGFEEGTSKSRRNVLVTVAADHVLEGLEIKNILRQTSVSTRNYLLYTPLVEVPAPIVCGDGIRAGAEQCDDGNTIQTDACLNNCTTPITVVRSYTGGGDCRTVTCPTNAPYVSACSATFSGTKERGCAAWNPATSAVYFKENRSCTSGGISNATIRCTNVPTVFNLANCRLDSGIDYYVARPSGCPQ